MKAVLTLLLLSLFFAPAQAQQAFRVIGQADYSYNQGTSTNSYANYDSIYYRYSNGRGSTWYNGALNNTAKADTYMNYTYTGGIAQSKERIAYGWDNNGNMLWDYVELASGGTFAFYQIDSDFYDAAGNEIKTVLYSATPNGPMLSEGIQWTYISANKILTQDTRNYNTTTGVQTSGTIKSYYYNGQGLLDSIRTTILSGGNYLLFSLNTYAYDAAARDTLLVIKTCSPLGSTPQNEYVYHYGLDASGAIITENIDAWHAATSSYYRSQNIWNHYNSASSLIYDSVAIFNGTTGLLSATRTDSDVYSGGYLTAKYHSEYTLSNSAPVFPPVQTRTTFALNSFYCPDRMVTETLVNGAWQPSTGTFSKANYYYEQIPAAPTGIINTSFLKTVKAYPIPATDQVTIFIGSTEVKAANSIQIYDLRGRILLQAPVTGMNTVLNLATLPAGNYLLEINGGKGYRQMIQKL